MSFLQFFPRYANKNAKKYKCEKNTSFIKTDYSFKNISHIKCDFNEKIQSGLMKLRSSIIRRDHSSISKISSKTKNDVKNA